jgi:glycosyltransferase involved in cell wall biosynthesis
MQIVFVHQNFPAQFGHIARRLHRELGWRCIFVSQSDSTPAEGIEKIQYKPIGGATNSTHFCSRTFENTIWHCDAVYDALKARPDVQPDLIVGHSGFGSTLFLRELYRQTPVVNLFEYYYRPHDPQGDMDFRKDLGWKLEPHQYLRSRCRNAMILLDLQNCRFGYCPTRFQRTRFPMEYQQKLRTIFDGVDRQTYHGRDEQLRPALGYRGLRNIAGVSIGPNTRIVTYVSRGLESMRGFDMFLKASKLITQKIPDVAFFVVGSDRIAYGGDEGYLGDHKTFKEFALAQDQYDLSKLHFIGWQSPNDLATLLASTDLHIYLTVPFVLSWSMLDAMSSGAVVLGSSTAPVKEFIQDGVNGLLADFFNPQEFADKAIGALADPAAVRPLGRAAEETIAKAYSVDIVFPQIVKLYEDATRPPAPPAPPPPVPAPVAPSDSENHEPMLPAAAGLVSDATVVSKVRTPNRSPFRG